MDVNSIGDAKVFVDGAELGDTFGGIKVKEKSEKKPVKVDGVGVVQEVIIERTLGLEFALTEFDADQAVSVLPGTTKDSAGNVVLGNPAGLVLPSVEVTLKPIESGVPTEDVSKHWVFHKCSIAGILDLEFGDKQKQVKVDATCMYDTVKGSFGQIGNSPIV